MRLRGTASATNFALSDYRPDLAEYHKMQQVGCNTHTAPPSDKHSQYSMSIMSIVTALCVAKQQRQSAAFWYRKHAWDRRHAFLPCLRDQLTRSIVPFMTGALHCNLLPLRTDVDGKCKLAKASGWHNIFVFLQSRRIAWAAKPVAYQASTMSNPAACLVALGDVCCTD